MWTNRKISHVGLMVALSFLFSYLEFLVPLPFVVPGIKLGLANVVIVIPLYLWGGKIAFLISVIRILLVSITFGNMTYMIFSLVGAIVSLTGMMLFKKWKVLTPVGVSTIGGVFHNAGQLLIAMIVVRSLGLFYYFPVLLIGGSITGYIIGLISLKVLVHLQKKPTDPLEKEYVWTDRKY